MKNISLAFPGFVLTFIAANEQQIMLTPVEGRQASTNE